eukprot:6047016-Amphidinium_carterae.1
MQAGQRPQRKQSLSVVGQSFHYKCLLFHQVIFQPAAGGEEVTVKETNKGELLKAEEGVVSGVFDCPAAGILSCHFRNEGHWDAQKLIWHLNKAMKRKRNPKQNLKAGLHQK